MAGSIGVVELVILAAIVGLVLRGRSTRRGQSLTRWIRYAAVFGIAGAVAQRTVAARQARNGLPQSSGKLAAGVCHHGQALLIVIATESRNGADVGQRMLVARILQPGGIGCTQGGQCLRAARR